jgi:hypothetical protein
VEHGYDEPDYESFNDIDARLTLQRVIDLLPAGSRERLMEFVEPLDERFRSATVEVDHGRRRMPLEWWDRRLPPSLVDDERLWSLLHRGGGFVTGAGALR